MGHPRKQRKKYSTPLHPWEASRIKDERQLTKEYGLKTKKEIWKAGSLLRKFKSQARSLIARIDDQAKVEEKQLLKRLSRLNLIEKKSKLDDVLGLGIRDVLDRRLQSILYKQKLAKTVVQARQFIVHGHVFVGDKKINVPSYLVSSEEEPKINFSSKSALFNPDHPERYKEEKKPEVKTQLKLDEEEEAKEEEKTKNSKKKEEVKEKAVDEKKPEKTEEKQDKKE